MKAVIMTGVGAPEVLRTQVVPMPELRDGNDIRVRLHAAGVNPIDSKLRGRGSYYPERMPCILGCDGAGVVDAVGEAVTRFSVGDEVYFFNGGIGGEPGNYAEYTVLHEDYAALKPRSMDFTQAAAVPLALITAWESLYDRANLQHQHFVLVHAGAGGVGHIAIQLARISGAEIITTVSGAGKSAFVRALGASHVIDYREQDFVEEVLRITQGRGCGVVLDTVGGETFCRSVDATRVYGDLVTLLQSECDTRTLSRVRQRNLRLSYELMLTPLIMDMPAARLRQTSILEEGATLIDAGQLRVEVAEVLSLEQAAMAHEKIEQGHTQGKIVLKIA